MKRTIIMLALLPVFIRVHAQPANEINCFQYFQYDYVGNSKTNAYLLMMLNHWNSPLNLLNITDDNDPRAIELHEKPDKFIAEYRKKVGHYFYNPNTVILAGSNDLNLQPELRTTRLSTTEIASVSSNQPAVFSPVFYNGGNGYDPEAIVISTAKYIIVVFRGTDRVANNITLPVIGDALNKFVYSASEWIVTDFNFIKTTPQENLGGKVHSGFTTSLLFIKQRLEDTLSKYGAANKKIWITGHSLGSAQAQLFAGYLKKKFSAWDIRGVYAYAAPHVGDAAFVSQLNSLLPGARLQRFDFMDDPITHLPRFYMGYQRAGIRNLYTKEQGANYNFDADEAGFDLGKFFFCLHHTHWYARAAFFELIDHNPELQGKIPNAPPRPTYACSNIDLAYVTGSINLLTAGSTDLPEGKYYIVMGKDNKYIDAPYSTADQNGTLLQLYDIGNSLRNNQWVVKKVPGALIESYTIQAVHGGKYMDADFFNTDNNGCKIQLWDRGTAIRTNQEWKISRLSNGAYQIINVKSDTKALDADDCTNTNGCKLRLMTKSSVDPTQQWYFVKVE